MFSFTESPVHEKKKGLGILIRHFGKPNMCEEVFKKSKSDRILIINNILIIIINDINFD